MATKEDIARLKRREEQGLTPEEEALRKQRMREGQAELGAQEKAANLAAGGANVPTKADRARGAAAREVGTLGEFTGQRTVEEVIAAKEGLTTTLGEQGAFEEPPAPVDIKTGIAQEGLFETDIASIQAIRTTAFLNSIDKKRIKEMGYKEFLDNPEVVSDVVLSQIVKNEVDFEVLKSGEATASTFGTFIEGIPVAGSLARKYAGGLITTPSSQIDDITSNIGTQVARARNLREWVGMGTLDPQLASEELSRIDQDLLWLESKLKFLIIQSPELKSAPEEVDTIEDKIQEAKLVVFNARQKVGVVTVTGAESDTELGFMTLKRLKNEKSK